jgi:hypothetical protein
VKHLRELKKHLERRYCVRVRFLRQYRGAHPVMRARARGEAVEVLVSGSPSDKRRELLNAERTLKQKFRAVGVELERRP